MIDQVIGLIIDESKWLTGSMGLALLGASFLLYKGRRMDMRQTILAAMNLFFGMTIGAMAFGHLLAVTTKLLLGTLEGSLIIFYLIGILLAVPSWWLISHALKLSGRVEEPGRTTIILNGWVAVTLLGMGVHNVPLAAQAFFNVWYQFNTRKTVGWVVVVLAVLANVGLFIGSLIFLASGQTFEQFRGME